MFDRLMHHRRSIRKYLHKAIISIGYPAETKPPHDRQTLKFDTIYQGQFGVRRAMA